MKKKTSSFTVFKKWFYIEDLNGFRHFILKSSIVRFSNMGKNWIIIVEGGKYGINVSESTWDELSSLMVEE